MPPSHLLNFRVKKDYWVTVLMYTSSFARKLILSLVLLGASLFIPFDASAQLGLYSKRGFGLGGSLAISNGSSLLGASGSLVLPGVEIGFGIDRSSPEPDLSGELTAISTGPRISVYPVRQGSGLPFSMLLRGTYSMRFFTGPLMEEVDSQGAEGASFSLSSGLFRSFEISESVAVVPFVGVVYTQGTVEIYGSGVSVSSIQQTTGLSLNIPFKFKNGSNYFVLAPIARFGGFHSAFGISAFFVFPSTGG